MSADVTIILSAGRRRPRPLRYEPLEPRVVLSHTLVISEFMAANAGTLDDEDGDASDWIEVHNPTADAVNLAGWSLSDDLGALRKWRLPAMTLPSGEHLVVFASDKDRTDPESELHTNFKLSAGGEYLALVQPDGQIAQAFAPQFPPQRQDVSYGREAPQLDATILISRGAAWQFLDDGSDQGAAWRLPGFDSRDWPSGRAPLGYGDGDEATVVGYGPDASEKYPTTYFRRTFDVSGVDEIVGLTLRLVRDDGAVVYINGQEVLRENMPSGSIDFRTYAARNAVGESTLYRFDIARGVLVEGENTIAVEIHQATASSPDISFDLILESYVQAGEPRAGLLHGFDAGRTERQRLRGFLSAGHVQPRRGDRPRGVLAGIDGRVAR